MPIKKRIACRGLIVSEVNEILVMKIENPSKTWTGWIAPGETHELALRRELLEELGLEKFEIGPLVWNRIATFLWDTQRIEQSEAFYFIRTPKFSIEELKNPDEGEKKSFRGFRWWTLDEIHNSKELFAPRKMGLHLKTLLKEGVPQGPLDVGT